MSRLTVILPCAGEGSRLSLPYSKEVFSIEKKMVDFDKNLGKPNEDILLGHDVFMPSTWDQ